MIVINMMKEFHSSSSDIVSCITSYCSEYREYSSAQSDKKLFVEIHMANVIIISSAMKKSCFEKARLLYFPQKRTFSFSPEKIGLEGSGTMG